MNYSISFFFWQNMFFLNVKSFFSLLQSWNMSCFILSLESARTSGNYLEKRGNNLKFRYLQTTLVGVKSITKSIWHFLLKMWNMERCFYALKVEDVSVFAAEAPLDLYITWSCKFKLWSSRFSVKRFLSLKEQVTQS